MLFCFQLLMYFESFLTTTESLMGNIPGFFWILFCLTYVIRNIFSMYMLVSVRTLLLIFMNWKRTICNNMQSTHYDKKHFIITKRNNDKIKKNRKVQTNYQIKSSSSLITLATPLIDVFSSEIGKVESESQSKF